MKLLNAEIKSFLAQPAQQLIDNREKSRKTGKNCGKHVETWQLATCQPTTRQFMFLHGFRVVQVWPNTHSFPVKS